MAQLVDFSQIVIGSFMMASKFSDADIDTVRPAVLNTLRIYRTKFVSEFGELINKIKSSRSSMVAENLFLEKIYNLIDEVENELV